MDIIGRIGRLKNIPSVIPEFRNIRCKITGKNKIGVNIVFLEGEYKHCNYGAKIECIELINNLITETE